jgi:hypothetical protein
MLGNAVASMGDAFTSGTLGVIARPLADDPIPTIIEMPRVINGDRRQTVREDDVPRRVTIRRVLPDRRLVERRQVADRRALP